MTKKHDVTETNVAGGVETPAVGTATSMQDLTSKNSVSHLANGGSLKLEYELLDEKGEIVRPLTQDEKERRAASYLLEIAAKYELCELEEHWKKMDAIPHDEEDEPFLKEEEEERRTIRLFLAGVINHEVGLVDLVNRNANMISAWTISQLGDVPEEKGE